MARRMSDGQDQLNDGQGKQNFPTSDYLKTPSQHLCDSDNPSPDEIIQKHLNEIKRIRRQMEAQTIDRQNLNRHYKVYGLYENNQPVPHTLPVTKPQTYQTTEPNPTPSEASDISDTTNISSAFSTIPPKSNNTKNTQSFDEYRDNETPDLSMTTSTGTTLDHDLTKILQTPQHILQKPRLTFPPTNPIRELAKLTITKPQPQYKIPAYHRFKPYPKTTIETTTQQHNPSTFLQQQTEQHNPHPTLQQQFSAQQPYQQPAAQQHTTSEQKPTITTNLRRINKENDLQLLDEIHNIVYNDQFVETLGTPTITKHSDSDSDTNSDSPITMQTYTPQRLTTTTPIQRQPETKSPITNNAQPYAANPTPKPRHNLQAQTKQNIANHNTPEPETKKTNMYNILYDESNFYCGGKGWKTEFMKHSHDKIFDKLRTNMSQPEALKITTDKPFSDLYTQIRMETRDARNQEMIMAEHNATTSSSGRDASLRNLLTSTINESPPLSKRSQNSPMQTVTEIVQTHDQHEHTNPQYINNFFQEQEEIDNNLRSSYEHINTSHNTHPAETASLPADETSNYQHERPINQTDGNDTDQEDGATNDTEHDQIPLPQETPDHQIKIEILHKLEQLKIHGSTNYLRDTTKILQEAREYHNPNKPESHLQRTIRKQIEKHTKLSTTNKERQPHEEQTDTNTPQTPPPMIPTDIITLPNTINTTSEEESHNETQQTTGDEFAFNSPDLDHEQITKIVEHNKDIIKQLTIRTDDEELTEEVNDFAQQLQKVTEQLSNLTNIICNPNKNEDPQTETDEPNTTHNDVTKSNDHQLQDPYINDFTDTHPLETNTPPTSGITTVHLNNLTPQQIKEMQARTSHRCHDRFETIKDILESVKLQIQTAMLPMNALEAADITPRIRIQLKQTKKHLIALRYKQISLEKKLHKISETDTNNNIGIIMPTYGTEKRNVQQWKNIPVFNPKQDTGFDIVWSVIAARGSRLNLDEDSYKEILEETLKGEALRYYTKNQNKSLRAILEILFNSYVTKPSKRQIRTLLENFKVHKNDNIKQTLEKLKLLTTEYVKDLPPDQATHEEDMEIKRRLIENSLVNPAVLVTVYRKEKENRLEGKHFDFIRELIEETEIQTEAGAINPTSETPVNTLALYNTEATAQHTKQPMPKEGQRTQIGKNDQNHLSARPRRPSQEKIDRMFRHSPNRNRQRSTTPNPTTSRNQSPSPSRSQSPRHISDNIQRDTQNRQRNSRQAEYEKKRFNQKDFRNEIEKEAQTAFKNQQPTYQKDYQRQNSHDPQSNPNPRYQQLTNNQFPQNTKPRSSSVAPDTRRRSPQRQPYRNDRNNYQDRQNYNKNNNYNPKPFFNKENYQSTYNQNNRDRSYDDYNRNHNPNQNQNNNKQNNNYQNDNRYQPPPKQNNYREQQPNNNYKQRDQYNNYKHPQNTRILQHHMTYTGGNNREGKVRQEFSFSELCNKRACQHLQEHSYKSCPKGKDFQDRH